MTDTPIKIHITLGNDSNLYANIYPNKSFL